MMQIEKQLEQQSENKEYSFEEGVQKSVSKILELLQSKESVIVSVTGSSFDVGKTTLASKIVMSLKEKGIETKWCGSISTLAFESEFPKPGEVLMLHAEYFSTPNNEIEKKAKEFNLPFSKIDLRIFIYRPDKPFAVYETKLADIIIRNEEALDKVRN